jgi:molybdopterin molybdotransferase
MITVTQALDLVRRHARPIPPQPTRLLDSLGLVLAEDVSSDVDSPPHDKALVDGYALRAADIQSAGTPLKVIEQVLAGSLPRQEVTPGTATHIMTGAPIPSGADAVVMVERTSRDPRPANSDALSASTSVPATQSHEADIVHILLDAVQPGENILRQGVSMRKGEIILTRGKRLRPIEIGLLAEVGSAETLAHPRPRVAVLSTGDELVPHEQTPAAGQIRNSNGPMLTAQVVRSGGIPTNLGIAPDQEDLLTQAIQSGLQHDVLVLSGGVSAGVMDLTPKILERLGVSQVFHQVELKPGKPIWFGVRETDGGTSLVFGLPGNPVSSLVCFELFVRLALDLLSGGTGNSLATTTARLTHSHQQRGNRPTYFPADYRRVDGKETVCPLAWKGSADLRTLAHANSLAYFPPGDRCHAEGDEVQVHLMDGVI